ncbi:hypothetical protein ERO13_A10G135700v2 [Gossypium hirsutum]|nr:hypothetical protein ERO13_A10G135700v2 [Gossypium hirsutum]
MPSRFPRYSWTPIASSYLFQRSFLCSRIASLLVFISTIQFFLHKILSNLGMFSIVLPGSNGKGLGSLSTESPLIMTERRSNDIPNFTACSPA